MEHFKAAAIQTRTFGGHQVKKFSLIAAVCMSLGVGVAIAHPTTASHQASRQSAAHTQYVTRTVSPAGTLGGPGDV